MNNLKCPICASSNTTVGINADSTNVAFLCNFCNFRDILYYGESRIDAVQYFMAVSRPRNARYRMRVTRMWPQVSRVRFTQYSRNSQARRYTVALLPLMRSRVVEPGDIPPGDVFIAGMRISEFM